MNLQTPKVLWAAMSSSVPMFAVVLATMGKLAMTDDAAKPVGVALAAASLFAAVLSVMMPRLQFRQALAQARFELKDVPDERAMPTHRDDGPTVKAFAHPQAALRRATALFQTPFILSMALAESIAAMGLVVGMQGFGLLGAAPFFVVALVLFGVHFPREATVVRALREVYGAQLKVRAS